MTFFSINSKGKNKFEEKKKKIGPFISGLIQKYKFYGGNLSFGYEFFYFFPLVMIY